MDPSRFDALARALTAATPRRRALVALPMGAFAHLTSISVLEARKKKKKKKKKCKVNCAGKVCGPSNCPGKSCGACPDGESCRANGRCACEPEPLATTCAGIACGPATNNCGQPVTCQCAQPPCADATCQNGTCVIVPKDPGDSCNGSDGLCCGSGLNLTCKAVSDDLLNCGACGNDCGPRADQCVQGECRCGNHPQCPVVAACHLGTCQCSQQGEIYCGGQCIQAACCVQDEPGVLCGGVCVANVCCGPSQGCTTSDDCCHHGSGPGYTVCVQGTCCLDNGSACTQASAHKCCSGHCSANFCL